MWYNNGVEVARKKPVVLVSQSAIMNSGPAAFESALPRHQRRAFKPVGFFVGVRKMSECQFCGEQFKVVSSRAKHGRGKYCSRDCMYASMRLDIAGERYGRLTAVRETERRQNRKVIWECLCDCGNTVYIPSNHLRTGNTKSCGCLHFDVVATDIAGNRYNSLVAIEPAGRSNGGDVLWRCECDCGNETTMTVGNLESGSVYSCGCQHPSQKDLSGEEFGRLTVLEYVGLVAHGNQGSQARSWLCKCDCGNRHVVKTSNLTSGAVRSCGCLQIDAVSLPENRTIKKVVRKQRRRRKREKEADDGTITPASIRNLLSRVGRQCMYCGGPYEQLDHVMPLSRGGSHSIDNVVPACGECNWSKSDSILGDGWWPPAWDRDSLTVPQQTLLDITGELKDVA